ncbi:lanthionine synthetase C family protein [Glycomyces harbinensis]|uniref:Lanthionine synthetase C-like protein n=1 Tax=Glycomyces harbinensis TaxID=58114 RepID=A0A1G6WVF5_9ACTN|nr:lanthionine synthetase C family protein [Glycomyces harbinensis]SDD69076.1 Lanthionine synthetase C-like protein [Glycomyces harbinensis]
MSSKAATGEAIAGIEIPAGLRGATEEAAEVILRRLMDREVVADAVRESVRRADFPYQWGGVPLYGGHTGQALVCDQAARALPGEAEHWREATRAWLREAVAGTRDKPLDEPGIGYGTAGLALAVSQCAVEQPGFRKTANRIDARLAEQVANRPDPRRFGGVNRGAFDAIQGSAGILGYLVTVEEPDPAVTAAIDGLIDDLIWLCTPEPDGRRRWIAAPEYYVIPGDHDRFPHGYLDLGLAHGICGPLATLSMAWSAGHRRPGQREAIHRTADDLVRLSIADEWGRNWARLYGVDASGVPDRPLEPLGRTAWCYGAPGVSSALLDAADALGNDDWREVAVDGFHTEMRRLRDGSGHIDAATLCHGLSGPLLIAQKIADRTGDEAMRGVVLELVERILGYCDFDLPLVVQEIHIGAPGIRLDSPGLLDGAAGVALALWSTLRPQETAWQRALLIR